MKSLAKAAIIIACMLLSGYMTMQGHSEMGVLFLLFAGLVAVFYEAQWK
ncbi:hypothetical protein [Spirosoma oryzicola]|nr:hypothetical protein [Spirosoma oryzicola]UHG93231.1 hypothetical protein LQ777_10100 [Spirosoma oryzicola]